MDKYYGIIIVVASAISITIGIVHSHAAKQEDIAIWGLTRTGIVLVGFAILGGMLGIKVQINENKIKNNPIVISPATNLINLSEYTNKIPFEVYNRGDDAKYSVWVDISVETKHLNKESVIYYEIIAADGRRFVPPQGGELFNEEILFIPSMDEDHTTHMLLLFRSLSPKATNQFEVRITSTSLSEKSQSLKLLFNVIKFKNEPYPFLLKGDSAFVEFEFPINSTPLFPFMVLEKKTTHN